jgi:hypothetical protein
MATRGSMPQRTLAVSAEAMAIWASSASVGLGMTAQSAKTNMPWSPMSQSGTIMMKELETMLIPGLVLMICRAGRMVSPVECRAPETSPSASPLWTIMVP